MKRYDTWIHDEEGLARVLRNLKANPQLEMLSFTMTFDSQELSLVPEQHLIDALQKLPRLQALRIGGDNCVDGFSSKEGLQSLAAISTLKSLQLMDWPKFSELQHCKSLEWFSIKGFVWGAKNFPNQLQQVQCDIIHLYRVLFEVELLLPFLPLLRGCIVGEIPITIVNGRARPLLSRPSSAQDITRLLDDVWGFNGQQLWHWD
jgi:hypothetical protein